MTKFIVPLAIVVIMKLLLLSKAVLYCFEGLRDTPEKHLKYSKSETGFLFDNIWLPNKRHCFLHILIPINLSYIKLIKKDFRDK